MSGNDSHVNTEVRRVSSDAIKLEWSDLQKITKIIERRICAPKIIVTFETNARTTFNSIGEFEEFDQTNSKKILCVKIHARNDRNESGSLTISQHDSYSFDFSMNSTFDSSDLALREIQELKREITPWYSVLLEYSRLLTSTTLASIATTGVIIYFLSNIASLTDTALPNGISPESTGKHMLLGAAIYMITTTLIIPPINATLFPKVVICLGPERNKLKKLKNLQNTSLAILGVVIGLISLMWAF